MKLSKESKIRLLENFYAIDYIFFNESLRKIDVHCSEDIEEYLSIKGALTSVMIEMFDMVSHSPDIIEEHIDSKKLHIIAQESAEIARKNSKHIMESAKSQKNIKNEIQEAIKLDKESDIEEVTKLKIQEKAYGLALDNLLIARMISESTNYQELNTWAGKIVEDAYKVLRDSLIESAIAINANR